ncbi:NACHT domain-containing protein [Pseudanabaena biceps]|nr:NACHT domain-containing protein [Pseudanabaena biceps]
MSKDQSQESEQGIEIDNATLTNSPVGQAGNDLVQGDHNIVVKYFLDLAGLTQPEKMAGRDESEVFLLGEVTTEVKSRLRHSLHREVAITLDKEMQLDRVRTWSASVKIGMQVIEQIENGTSILNVFQREDVGGRLLILGKPGAGKTTTYLELANELLDIAESDLKQPIPILCNLSSWKDSKQSIADWVMAEAKSKYGVRVEVAQNLLKRKQLLPMLDGLDELEPHRQEPCILAINQWMESEHRPRFLVVCSRSEEYDSYSVKFKLNAAIYLQPLSDEQLSKYFKSPELWQKLRQDSELLEILRTPFFLVITFLAIQQISPPEWGQLATTNDRKTYLLSAYVHQMLSGDIESLYYQAPAVPSAAQTKHWLSWLAQQLQQESKDEFLIESLHPKNLKNGTQQKNYYRVLVLIFGLFFGLFFGIIYEKIGWLIFGLFYGLFLGLFVGINDGLKAVLKDDFMSRRYPNQGILSSLQNDIWITLFSILVWSFGMFFLWQVQGIQESISILYLLILGIGGSIMFGFYISRAEAQNDIWITLFSILVWSFGMFFLWQVQSIQESISILNLLILGIGGSIMFGFYISGAEAPKHFILRCLLYRNGSSPWNYARFLNYSTERMLLQRVGGRYRFIHRLLQEHFAAQISDK